MRLHECTQELGCGHVTLGAIICGHGYVTLGALWDLSDWLCDSRGTTGFMCGYVTLCTTYGIWVWLCDPS